MFDSFCTGDFGSSAKNCLKSPLTIHSANMENKNMGDIDVVFGLGLSAGPFGYNAL